MGFRLIFRGFICLCWFTSFTVVCAAPSEFPLKPDATIVIKAESSIKEVNRDVFGIALAKLYRQQWRPRVDLQNPSLKALLDELAPTFITLDNTQLGLPFNMESVGEKSQRLSIRDSVERMNIVPQGAAKQLLSVVAHDHHYRHSPHKNYDDLLQFFRSLENPPDFAIRIPIFFTDVQGVFRSLSHQLDPESGLELIQYLNDDPDESDYGKRREENGYKDPYNVKYIVLGNELWSNYMWEGLPIKDIARQIKVFSDGIRAKYPAIKLGVNLVDDSYPHKYLKPGAEKKYKKLMSYNQSLLAEIKENIDFVTFHVYGGLGTEDLNRPLNRSQWQYILSQSFFKSRYKVAQRHFSVVGGDYPVAISEYGGPTSTLGGAVYNADYIIYMLENGYEYATGWSLGIMEPDNHFGIIGVDSKSGGERYYRKPNFYTLKLFTHYMKGELVNYTVNSPKYDTPAIKWERYYDWPAETGIPSLSMVASRSEEKIYAIVVNRNIDSDIRSLVEIDGVSSGWTARLFTLSGDAPDTTQVEFVERTQLVKDKSLELIFKKHSVTAIEFTPL